MTLAADRETSRAMFLIGGGCWGLSALCVWYLAAHQSAHGAFIVLVPAAFLIFVGLIFFVIGVAHLF
jgi:hypothetical protein